MSEFENTLTSSAFIFSAIFPEHLQTATNHDLSLAVRNRGDNEAMSALVRRHKGLIVKTATRYAVHHPSWDDSLSAALFFMAEFCRTVYPNPRFPNSSWVTALCWHWRAKMGRYARQNGARHIVMPERWYSGKSKRDVQSYAVAVVEKPIRWDAQSELPDILVKRTLSERVAQLDDMHRAVIIGRYWEGLNYLDIGRKIKKTPEWARVLHDKAIDQLRQTVPVDLALALG